MKFYDREAEMKLMDTLYRSKPSFLVLTGKRRVGKTELLKQFISSRNSLYLFVDSNKSISILLAEYERYVKERLVVPDYIRFETPENLIDFLFDYKDDLVVVFDEFQRFLKIDPTFITTLQKQWDLKGNKSRLFLVASGSSIGMIKKIFIESKSPLFKRADNILTLRPFSVHEIFNILDDMGIRDLNEKLDIYCLFGGTIYYYRLMEKYNVHRFDDAIDRLILNDLAPLRNEVRDVIIEEFGREHSTYYEIVSALALGKASKKEIGDLTHIETTSLSPYLYDLIDLLQIVEHVVPVTETSRKSKRGRYFLKDNFFRFYFRFIYKKMSDYQLGIYEGIRKDIQSAWPEFRGRLLEDIALEYVRGELSNLFPHLGRFWNRYGTEIDIVGINRQTRRLLTIEVKSRTLSGKEAEKELSKLAEKAREITGKFRKTFYGLIAPKVRGKQGLRNKGYYCWDFEDIFG